MDISNEELTALATAIAADLGDGWRLAQHPEGWLGTAFLERPDGARLMLSSGRDRTGKLHISGAYPEHDLSRSNSSSINVAAGRGAAVIAREIRRRLLPDYLADLARVVAHNRERELNRVRRRELAEELAKMIGGSVYDDDRSHRTSVSSYRDGQSTDVKINHSANSGDFKATSLSVDQLRALAAVLQPDSGAAPNSPSEALGECSPAGAPEDGSGTGQADR